MQALLFPEHANPEDSLILFHYSYSQYKYRNIFKETNDIQIILTYCNVVDLLYNPNNNPVFDSQPTDNKQKNKH